MNDTPKHVRDLQREIWLQKSPAERLLRTIVDNEELFLFWKAGKEAMKKRLEEEAKKSAS